MTDEIQKKTELRIKVPQWISDLLKEHCDLYGVTAVSTITRVHCWQLSPTVEILSVQHALGTQVHGKVTLAFIGNHANRITTCRVDQLDRV